MASDVDARNSRLSHASPSFYSAANSVSEVAGKQLWKPMWLLVLGQRRTEVTPVESYWAYRQRFDLEQ